MMLFQLFQHVIRGGAVWTGRGGAGRLILCQDADAEARDL